MAEVVPYFVEALFVGNSFSFRFQISTVDDGVYWFGEGFEVTTSRYSTYPLEAERVPNFCGCRVRLVDEVENRVCIALCIG